MSVAISWADKMQLAKCDIMVGFPISSHNYCLALIATITCQSTRQAHWSIHNTQNSPREEEKIQSAFSSSTSYNYGTSI